jgi:hypothetical protein
MAERERKKPSRTPRVIVTVVVALVLLAALAYVGRQVLYVVQPQNDYETALMATVLDTVDADGVLVFNETIVAGSGDLGYLVSSGERVSAGTAVAEVYTNDAQSALRTQLTDLESQISLLEKSQYTSTTQLDSLLKERTTALYDMMETLDRSNYENLQTSKEAYVLAQNKLGVTTGEVEDFSTQITDLQAQYAAVSAQLGSPQQITSPVTGYFIGAESTRQLNRTADEIAAMSAAELNAWLEQGADSALDGCAGKTVSGFTWYYYGVCTAKQAEKLLGSDGKMLKKKIQIRFPGQMEDALTAQLTEVTVDAENGIARFVLRCDSINGDVLRLGQANAQIIVGSYTGLRVKEAAIHYIREEDGTELTEEEKNAKGENYIPGVYVKYGNLARFCRIDPVDSDHPRITDGEYVIVLPSGTDNSVSQVQLYDEVIVQGKNLYDGKLL